MGFPRLVGTVAHERGEGDVPFVDRAGPATDRRGQGDQLPGLAERNGRVRGDYGRAGRPDGQGVAGIARAGEVGGSAIRGLDRVASAGVPAGRT